MVKFKNGLNHDSLKKATVKVNIECVFRMTILNILNLAMQKDCQYYMLNNYV